MSVAPLKSWMAANVVFLWAMSVPGNLGVPTLPPADAALATTSTPALVAARPSLAEDPLVPLDLYDMAAAGLTARPRGGDDDEPGDAVRDAALAPVPGGPAVALALAATPADPASSIERMFGGPGRPAAPATADPAPPPPAPERVDALRRALAHLRKGELAEAEAIAQRQADPALASLIEWMHLRALRNPASFARIRKFAAAHADWPGRSFLQKRAENALLQEKLPAATVLAFFESRTPETAAGRIVLARSLDGRKDADRVAALVREAWRKDDLSVTFEAQIVAEFAGVLRVEDHRFRMERLMFRERFGDALRAAERAGKDYASLVKARQAVIGKAGNAKALLDAVPKTLRGDSSFAYSAAQFHRRRDEAKDAAAAAAKAPAGPDILGDGDEWWVERRLIARKLLDAGDAKTAYEVARDHVADTPPMRIEAEFHAGWIALRYLKDADLARRHFDIAADIAESPISSARAAYWRGRAAEALGEQDVATAHFRDAARDSVSYYGQLALGKLGADAAPALTLRADVRPGAAEGAAAIVDALALLYAVGERGPAMRLLADAGQESGDAALLRRLGDIATRAGDARGVLTLGKLATRRGLPLVEHAFPLAGIPAFTPVTEAVDKAMVYAIARQESAFDPAAVSHAGARGLMQLMPATAKRTADRFKVAFALPRLTTDAVYNAQIGAAHLRELMDEWNGSLILTFAAYNAGGHNVKKWIAAYGDPRDPAVDPVDWVERIPFTETRNYVQRVMENLQVYQVRLGARASVALNGEMRLGAKRQNVADGL